MRFLLFPQCFLLFHTHTLHSFVFKKRAKTVEENVSLLSTCRAIQLLSVTFFPTKNSDFFSVTCFLHLFPTKNSDFFSVTFFLHSYIFPISLSSWRLSAVFLNLKIQSFICCPLLKSVVTRQHLPALGDMITLLLKLKNTAFWFVFVYVSSLPVAHLSVAPRRQIFTGDSARIQDEITENSAWFFNVLGLWRHHTGPPPPPHNVSSERQ